MAYDEMELDLLGDRRTALFVIISDTDDTFNFVVSIMYTQLFNLLCDRADDQCGGQLKYHVRLLLDEFANIGLILKFDKLIATIRSREISASIILQSQSQLKTIYKDAAETIIGNCDTMLFLGGKESSTLKEISETLGKETIDLYNTSDTRGQSPSFGTTYQKTGKELMSRDELSVMDGSKCILQLRGVRPFLSDKFDITKHKRYKELSDFDKKNAFDVERYLKHELRLRMDEEFDCYEVDAQMLKQQLAKGNNGLVRTKYITFSIEAKSVREAKPRLERMPYVWGGSSPSTSFDCSGFVCWVINNCGNGWSVGRTTANGLRGKCSYVSPADAKPGDLIFFEKTYNTVGASHVGIYVGNGMMIHCGDPISYTSINSTYWQSHFLGFGRIN